MSKDLINTIEVIVSSPLLKFYYLGLSHIPKEIAPKIKKIGFDGYAIIDFELNGREAIIINKKLFEECTNNKKSVLYKKYHAEKRDKRFYPSLGGRKLDTKDRFNLFICWKNN
ncbi:hypothetical protein BMS3Abin03_02055 [bacterium BMS3Abin03]|nr:hypothetical protein BMS3Abin03_02055 [bacterium BMS3Abin03]